MCRLNMFWLSFPFLLSLPLAWGQNSMFWPALLCKSLCVCVCMILCIEPLTATLLSPEVAELRLKHVPELPKAARRHQWSGAKNAWAVLFWIFSLVCLDRAAWCLGKMAKSWIDISRRTRWLGFQVLSQLLIFHKLTSFHTELPSNEATSNRLVAASCCKPIKKSCFLPLRIQMEMMSHQSYPWCWTVVPQFMPKMEPNDMKQCSPCSLCYKLRRSSATAPWK